MFLFPTCTSQPHAAWLAAESSVRTILEARSAEPVLRMCSKHGHPQDQAAAPATSPGAASRCSTAPITESTTGTNTPPLRLMQRLQARCWHGNLGIPGIGNETSGGFCSRCRASAGSSATVSSFLGRQCCHFRRQSSSATKKSVSGAWRWSAQYGRMWSSGVAESSNDQNKTHNTQKHIM